MARTVHVSVRLDREIDEQIRLLFEHPQSPFASISDARRECFMRGLESLMGDNGNG